MLVVRLRRLLGIVAIAALHVPAGRLVAAPPPEGCLPGLNLKALSGRWQADALAHVPGGVAPSRQRLQLEVGADGRVSGRRDWAALHTGTGALQGRNRQGQPTFRDGEPLIGWIDPRSCRVLLVETEDTGRVEGQLRQAAGAPVLDVAIAQSGAGAVVVMAVFRQLAASPPAPGRR